MWPLLIAGLLVADVPPGPPPGGFTNDDGSPLTAQADAGPSPQARLEAQRVVKAMQIFYERAKDCKASFTQTYLNQAFHRTLTSRGTLRFKKPGLLRFDYSAPEPKFFVVKNDRITTYVPAAQQAMVGSFKADQLSASVTFLFGKGNLESEFNVQPAARGDLAKGIALELTPKREEPRFQKLFFVVDPRTFAVRQSVVVDPSGNENRFDFSDIQVGVGLGEKDFDDSLPAGTQIVKMGG